MSKWLFFAFLLVLLMLDFHSRLWLELGTKDLVVSSDSDIVEAIPLRKAYRKDELVAAFDTFKPSLEDKNEVVAEDLVLESTATVFFAENNKFELKAVISDSDKFALLKITDLKSGSAELVKIKDTELVKGFKVAIVSATQVILSMDQLTQALMMYQPSQKEKSE